ncbi:MAG: hypothetical protein KKB50_13075 [Planctomycetes bacterium]|nr:hypothetical protein [Planctomycetota bacterium]
MSSWVSVGQLAVILASNPLLRAIQTRLRSGPAVEQLLVLLLGSTALLGALLLAYRFLNNERRKPTVVREDYLTRALDTLGLAADERALIKSIARQVRSPFPESMLLSPGNLAYAAQHALRDEEFRRAYRKLNRLCVRLFGDPLPVVPPEADHA